jgi:hypothetical protein
MPRKFLHSITTTDGLVEAVFFDYLTSDDVPASASSPPPGGISDGDYGDIVVSGSGTVWTIDTGVVTTGKLGGDITTAGKALLDDANAADQRTTLGLGTAATANTGDFDPAGAASAAVAAHEGAGDPHPQYLTVAEGDAAYQPLDGDLTAIAALTGTNTIYYRSAANTWTAVVIGANLTFSGGTLSASGGGGGGSATTVEVNLGSAMVFQGKFTITDAAITATSKVLCWQAPGPYTGKGTLADEAVMQPVQVIAVVPGSGSAVVHWQTPPMLAPQNPSRMAGQPANNVVPGAKDPQAIADRGVKRVGNVRGNVKFSYTVLS